MRQRVVVSRDIGVCVVAYFLRAAVADDTWHQASATRHVARGIRHVAPNPTSQHVAPPYHAIWRQHDTMP